MTSFRDVTERRTLADELIAANAVAHDALRQKADFLANVSHDLKTPLSAILGFANALKRSANADAALTGARIVEQGEELLVMVGDLLDRAALDAGRLTPRSSSFVVKDMLSSIRDVLLHAAADRGVELITEVDSEIPLQVVGDKNRIRRILMNIAANAIKFSDGGAVVIFVTRGPTPGFLRFVVSDRGPGLSDRIAAQVFERFTTATAAGATDRRGYGLGLAICRELVEELGGQIGHRSAGETGTTFWFDIPLPLSAQIDPFAGGRAVSPLNILVVDDNIAFQHIIGSMLRALGHSVVCANNAKQGMAAAKEAAYDLYYIDRGLPDKNGLDLIRQLRQAGIDRPMVLVSADDSSIADEGAVMPDAFLAKPLDPTDVVASLSTVARAS